MHMFCLLVCVWPSDSAHSHAWMDFRSISVPQEVLYADLSARECRLTTLISSIVVVTIDLLIENAHTWHRE